MKEMKKEKLNLLVKSEEEEEVRELKGNILLTFNEIKEFPLFDNEPKY